MLRWFEKHNVLCWVITVLIGVAIFYASSIESEPAEPGVPNIKAMIYHVLAFFFLAFFLSISLVNGKNKKLIILAIVLAILYGVSDELHQFFVPGRHMSLFDVFLDGAGVIFAVMIYFIVIEARKK